MLKSTWKLDLFPGHHGGWVPSPHSVAPSSITAAAAAETLVTRLVHVS